MANTNLQGIRIGAMVDGQIHLDQWDLHIAHGPVPCQIQLVLVVFRGPEKCFFGKSIAQLGAREDRCVILMRQFPGSDQVGIIDLLDDFLILCVDLGSVLFVVPV